MASRRTPVYARNHAAQRSFYDANVRDPDPVDGARYLHANVARGCTNDPLRSARDEGECSSHAEQEAQTCDAHRRDRARRLAAFVEAKQTINGALDVFTVAVGATIGRDVQDRLRTRPARG